MTLFTAKSVFIAGAGPVGLAAALELTRRGFPVRIVDPDPAPSPQSRALLVNARTLDLMGPSGTTDFLLAAGHRVNKLVVRKGTRVIGRLDLSAIPHRYNFLLVLAQSRTEAILANQLRSLGVEVERNLALTSFAAGRRIDLDLSDKTCSAADILIGADGAHSTVRKSLGLTFNGETEEQAFGLADAELSDWPFPFDTGVLTIMDGYLAPFIPMGEGHGRFITTKPDCLNHLPPDAKIKRATWNTDFRISFRQASTYQDDNVFLAGDAAHIHSPAGGRGMNLGIEDACWLAWLLEQGREQEYTTLRHPVGASVLRETKSFTTAARNTGLLQTLAAATLLPILSVFPPLRNRALANVTAMNTPAPEWF